MRAELDALVADHKVRIGSILALKVASFFSPNFLTSLYNSPGWAQAYTTDMDDWADDVRVKALATFQHCNTEKFLQHQWPSLLDHSCSLFN